MQPFWIFFVIAVALGWLASCCYYLAAWRLVKAGIQVKLLAMPKDTFRVLRQYRDSAYENRLSFWPVYGFWLFSIPALCSAVIAAVYFNLQPTSANKSPAQFPATIAAVLWVSISSLVIALIFTYRVFRYLSEHQTTLWHWKQWSSDEYTRNDIVIATISWAGFLGSLLVFLHQIP